MIRSTIAISLLFSASVAYGRPLPEAAELAVTLGCGMHATGLDPLVTGDKKRLADTGLTVATDVPGWVSSNISAPSGPSTVYRGDSENGELYVIAYSKLPLCQVLVSGQAPEVADRIAVGFGQTPWTALSDESDGPARKRKFRLNGRRPIEAFLLSPSNSAPAGTSLVMLVMHPAQ